MDDWYAELGVAPDASANELKRAYRTLAKTWHPDKNPDPQAVERFKRIARAWEILSDPTRRRTYDRSRGRVVAGDVPEEHVDAVANAIERAQRWVEEVLVPHHASRYRGEGAEMSLRWIRELGEVDPITFRPVITRSGRRRARRWLRGAVVQFDDGPYPTSFHGTRRGFVIGVSPRALWEGGIREDPAVIDDAVLRLLSARYAQGVCTAVHLPDSDAPEAWEAAVARARARDARRIAADTGTWAVWLFVVALLVFMFTSAWIGW